MQSTHLILERCELIHTLNTELQFWCWPNDFSCRVAAVEVVQKKHFFKKYSKSQPQSQEHTMFSMLIRHVTVGGRQFNTSQNAP